MEIDSRDLKKLDDHGLIEVLEAKYMKLAEHSDHGEEAVRLENEIKLVEWYLACLKNQRAENREAAAETREEERVKREKQFALLSKQMAAFNRSIVWVTAIIAITAVIDILWKTRIISYWCRQWHCWGLW